MCNSRPKTKKDRNKVCLRRDFGMKPQSFLVKIVGLKDCSVNLVHKPRR